MPKKSIDKNPITIQSNQGSDSSSSDITLISGLDTSVAASDVISSNELGGYLGVDVQVNLDDLSSEVKNNQPPRVGFESITFSNDTDTITHDGRPDWGQAKIIDVPPWESVRKKWVSQYEMPHWGVGKRYDDTNAINSNAKYVNENGAYDTINLNYRDNRNISYYGLRIIDNNPAFMTDAPQDVHVGFPHIAQSVPRSVFKTGLKNESIYPFLYQKPFIPEETTRDIFNTSSYTLGFNAGEGTSSLGVKDGQPSVSLSSPFSTELFDPRDSDRIVDATDFNSPIFDVGLTLSGLLFPADRGVLALIRFSSENNDVAQSFNNVSATTVDDIEKRVVAAINLGQGAGINDGSPGGPIFNNSTSSSTFPSRITGQYDLYELHTGNYPPDVVRSGAIGGIFADPTIGRVRLLTESEAFFPTSGPSTRPGGIPVMFSPYEKHSNERTGTSISFNLFYSESNPIAALEAYAIDSADVLYACNINTFTNEIEITDDTSSITQPTTFYAYVLKENRSFLSYRLPVLKDYSSGLQTPYLERDRFFAKITPNEDQFNSDYDSKFETAGNYITFGKADNFSYQVARYRQVITLLRKYIAPFFGSESANDSEPEYNYGSFALIHFKTERAFESLVRDGVAPSDDEVYSRNLLDYSNLNNNLGRSLGTVGSDGLEDGISSFESSSSMSIFRPNLNFEKRFEGYPQDLVVKTRAKAWALHPTNGAAALRNYDTYFMWTSGVIYVNPTTWMAYKGHPSSRGVASATYSSDTQHSRIQAIVEITQKPVQGEDRFSEYDQTEPTNSKPFYTVRPTAQILTSDLTASNNLFSGKYERLADNTLLEYSTSSKHQQVWITSSGLDGNLAGNVVVIPKGDATKAVSDLSLYDSKDGFCTFTTVGLRPSVMINKPHRQFQNLGVEYIKDNLNDNSGSTIKKLLYHSSRKISLLELYGEKLIPNGTLIADESAISSVDDIYTSIDLTKNRVGEDYRSNNNFKYCYIWSDWNNTHVPTQIYTPKSSGQAFSIYRYDEEGFKVYQELELLPIGGEGSSYALELCSGWDWVRNDNDNDVGTVSNQFKYSIKVPVYRPVENTSTRASDKTHADARFLAIKGVDYYVECHPSIPYDWTTNTNPSGSIFDPTSFVELTEPKNAISDLGGLTKPDLELSFSSSLTNPTTNGTDYFSLYDFMSTTTSNHGEYVGHNKLIEAGSPSATVNPRLGATYHLVKIYDNNGTFAETTDVAHPHPTSSVRVDPGGFAVGRRHFGYEIVEVIPTGRRELPEYGNYTMDIRGYITVSGLGNKPSSALYDMHAVDTQTRQPLVSLFTPRKDTQERFLDESYRIEHSLKHIFQDKGNDPNTNYHFGNHTNTSGVSPAGGNTKLLENLIGPGIPNFGDGYNNGYIAFPVRDESNQSPEGWLSNTSIDLRLYSPHGYAGYLRNNFHTRRVQITTPSLDPSDWLEAQVSGFPNMTRNHLSGSKYGTPPRGVLIYPYQNFDGETTTAHGYDLSNSGAGTVNPLIDSEAGYYLPNSNAGLSGSDDVANNLSGDYTNAKTWVDDRVGDGSGGVSQEPFLRHAQPNYNYTATNDLPEVGYLRAFDLNFGKSNERTPHIPYWDEDWTETTTSGDKVDRLSSSATPQGLIESNQWQRVKKSEDGSVSFSTVKMRLVGVDWDMISYIDPQFPTARRDGTVYSIDNKKYLMRKRVMRVFVKVPGLTTWLDVGVMNGEVGESYVQYAGNNNEATFGIMSELGATSDKTDPSIDGAGCCVSYKETYLVEEGLVALDLELDLGFVPSFKSVGDNSISTTKIASYDDYLGQEKIIYVNNSDRNYIPTSPTDRAWGKGGREAPILVKVVLSNPDFPKYEVHPNESTALVNRDNLSDITVLFADVYGQSSGNDTIYDIWPSPNKSYRGHSYPPDDRAPTWARRGLMGIEVLRPDGTNFDRDEVIDRPEFASTALFGSQDATPFQNADDRSHYMLWRESAFKASGYVRGVDALKIDAKTNKQSYVFEDDMLDQGVDIVDTYSLSKKGEG